MPRRLAPWLYAAAAVAALHAAPILAADLTLAVIPKGTTHEFWKSIHAGALKAAAELDSAGTQVEIL